MRETGTIYDVDLDQTLPPALTRDPRMVALGKALAKQHQKTAHLIRENAGIFYQIEELDELMLDILATDLHVDWYDYNADLDEKRQLIKNSIAIHRMAGTPAGLRLAVESTHNEIELEEWFQYGGEPYFFRVGINIVDPAKEINQARILNIVRTYKPVRAHLEDDGIAFRSVQHVEIGMVGYGFVTYTAPRCGTRPGPATVGGIGTTGITIRAAPGGTGYATPKTGQAITGAHPTNATVGGMLEQSAIVATGAGGTDYAAPKTGIAVTGTHPNAATAGASGTSGMKTSLTADGTSYSGPVCGGGDFF